MPKFDFLNHRPATDFKEPQVGKKDLLARAPRTDTAFEEEDVKIPTQSGAFGSGLNGSSWGFGALDDEDLFTTHTPNTPNAQPKKSAASPRTFGGSGSGSGSFKRPGGNDGLVGQPANKKSKQSMVVDLTSDAEADDDLDLEPRGRSTTGFGLSNNTISLSQMNAQASTPAVTQARPTFRRGLSPYAPHKRKPAETHRAGPPIKPQDYSQIKQSNPAPPQKHAVFARKQTSTISPSPSPSTPAGLAGRLATRAVGASPKIAKKSGPFAQDSSDDEEETVTKQKTRSPSVTFLSRRRNVTPARNEKLLLLEQSRAKRQQKLNNGSGGAAAATTSATAQDAMPAGNDGIPESAEDNAVHAGESFLGLSRQGQRNGEVPEQYVLDDDDEDTIVVARPRERSVTNDSKPSAVRSEDTRPPDTPHASSLDHDKRRPDSKLALPKSPKPSAPPPTTAPRTPPRKRPVEHKRSRPVGDEVAAVREEQNAKPVSSKPLKPSVPPSTATPRTPAKKLPVEHESSKSLTDQMAAIKEQQKRAEVERQLWEERDEAERARLALIDSPSPPPSHVGPTLPGNDLLLPPLPEAPAAKKSKGKGNSLLSKLDAESKLAQQRRAREREEINRRRLDDEQQTEQAIKAAMQKEAEANHQILPPAPHGLGIRMNMHAEAKQRPVPTTEATPSARPPGSFSLNSAAGIAAISRTCDQPATAPRKINLPWEERSKQAAGSNVFRKAAPKLKLRTGTGHGRRLGTLTATDFALVRWKEERVSTDEVVQRYKDMTGQDRARSTLAERLSKVDTAVRIEEISPELREAAIAGDAAAAAEVNKILHDLQLDETRSKEEQRLATASNVPGNLNHKGDVTEVCTSDISLVKWRDQGHSWREVVDLYKRLAGEENSEQTLRRRYRKVKEAIEEVDEITTELCERVINGELDALEEMNTLLTQKAQEREGTATGASTGAQIKGTHTHRAWQKGGRQNEADARPATQSLASPPYSEGTPTSQQPTQQGFPPQTRATVGGKTLSDEAFRHYLEQIQEACYEDEVEDEEEQADEREPSPFTAADYCHFLYQIQRRECTKKQADDEGMTVDEQLDSQPWLACDDEFGDLDDANTAVMAQIMRRPRGAQAIATARNKWNLSSETDPNGLIEAELSSAVGKLQMRVTRYVRSFHDNVMPESKERWFPKTVYYVHVRTATRTLQDIHDGTESEIQEYILEDTSFTSLELANSQAIDEWLRRTLKHTTANLDQRTIERNNAKVAFEEALEEGAEGTRFSMEMDEEVGEESTFKRTRVWVKDGKLAGPRNL